MRTAICVFGSYGADLGGVLKRCPEGDVFVHLWGDGEISYPVTSKIVEPRFDVASMVAHRAQANLPSWSKKEGPWAAPIGLKFAPLFYSLMRSVFLKRQHELEQGFEYDCVVAVNTRMLGEITPGLIESNTIYGNQTYVMTPNGPLFAKSMSYFYGDSMSVDRAAQAFKYLSSIKEAAFKFNNGIAVTAGHLFYYHLCMLGIGAANG